MAPTKENIVIDYKDVILIPMAGNRYRTAIQINYKNIIIPKGFVTNGASIPRILWSFVPPNSSDIMPAIIVHDYLCGYDMYEHADNQFEKILIELNVGIVTRKYLVAGVKTWHAIAYKESGSPREWLRIYNSLRRKS